MQEIIMMWSRKIFAELEPGIISEKVSEIQINIFYYILK